MVYDMNVPSDNMLLSASEIARMTNESYREVLADEASKAQHEQAVADRLSEAYATQSRDYIYNQIQSSKNKASFLQSVKEGFLAACMMKLYEASISFPMTRRDHIVAENLVSRFIKENGAGNLLTDFATRNVFLSEMARIVNKHYRAVVEDASSLYDTNQIPKGAKPGEVKEYRLTKDIKDDFYEDLDKLDCTDAAKMIKDKVADSIQQFQDSNAYARMEYQDIIDQAKEKIASIKDDSSSDQATQEARIDEISRNAKRTINEMKLTRPKNMFNVMVEALTRRVLTDESYQPYFMHESSVDMEAVVDNTTLVYTMLEMLNTTNMVSVDEGFISEYLKTL